MVFIMDAVTPARRDVGREPVSRRRLLQLVGGAGAAAIVSGCEHSQSVTEPAAPTIDSPARPPSPPNPAPVLQPATPTTASAVPLSAASAVMLCRDAWGARPARAGGRPHTITRMTLHHEAVVLEDNRNAPGRFRQDQRYHQDKLGWVDIAYHVGIDRDGNIYELRTPQIAGDTATDYDTTGHFLVLCEGDFDKEVVSEAQLHGAALAFAWATQNFHIATDTLAGHRDLAQTSCPGANLYSHLSSGDLKRRIDDLRAAGPVNLQRICGTDAAATVAAIEAG
jgi:N-acetylmuramoyl-L-alanine amidase